MAVTLLVYGIEVGKWDIAPVSRLLRIRLSFVVTNAYGSPGGAPGLTHDAVSLYLLTPFGRNGPPRSFALYGDAISRLRAQFGMGRPRWLMPFPFMSKLHVVGDLYMTFVTRSANVRMSCRGNDRRAPSMARCAQSGHTRGGITVRNRP